MKEGASGGAIPTLQIFEFGPAKATRHPSDILPCLPIFRNQFAPLPKEPSDMVLKAVKVPVTDLECVTSAVVKIHDPIWYLNIRKGKMAPSPRPTSATINATIIRGAQEGSE
jgi:antiviral helicase SKI2